MKRLFVMFVIMFSALLLQACETEPETIALITVLDTVEREVGRYASFESLDLPDRISVELENGETRMIPVTWEAALRSYDASNVGTQVLQGRFILPDELVNPLNLRPTLIIVNDLADVMTTLENQPQFSILVSALKASGLDEVLLLRRDMTLLAPTNQAFNELFTLLGETESSFLERDDLYELLLHHVFAPSNTRGELLDAIPFTINSLDGGPLAFDFDGTRLNVNQLSRLDATDLMITNGVIHTVNRVVLSQRVIDSLIQDVLPDNLLEQFTELFSDPQILLQFLAGGGGVTIFAPSEEAFEAFAELNNIDLDDAMDDPNLIELLTYHVALSGESADELFTRAFNAPITIATLQGASLTIEVIDNQLAVNGHIVTDTADIADFANVLIIERVLIPPSLSDVYEDVIE